MSDKGNTLVNALTSGGKEYVKLKMEYYKLQGVEKGASAVAISVTTLILLLFILSMYVWGMISLMYFLKEEVAFFEHSYFKSSFALFLGHFALLIILLLFKGIIERSIVTKITVSSLKKLDEI